MNGHDLIQQLSTIRDPRQDWKIDHKLTDILLLTICGVIAGAEGWEEVEDFGHERLDWLQNYGDFDNGIPAHDTIARVISSISAKQFQQCFIDWMQACHEVTKGDVVAIDGKTVRRSYNKAKRLGPIHMVSAFSTANNVVLGQIKTAEKSNEITAIPELLKLLDIRGCIVTIDAMGCQKQIAQTILDKNADYLLAVKGNHKRLEETFIKHFSMDKLQKWNGEYFTTNEKAHGREETRMHITCETFGEFVDLGFEWPGLQTLGISISFRNNEGEVPTDATIRYFISSAKLTPKKFAEAVRSHWHIENKLHWKLDVAMREDDCRIRRGEAPEVFSNIRHVALNLLNKETTFKAGLKRKQKKAAMSTSYLAQVLAGQELS
ncbi:ISAs1 family transposase [Parashewanella tropica]|uniref:ISAs1 family transposase n=1 Tax=Parashewanella tropica TaxID=2547970 RepID=UPI00105AA883|nr:ISAs1 family transposase [Parashewanella tropica]